MHRRLSLVIALVVANPALAFEPLPRATATNRDMDPAGLAAAFRSTEQLGFVDAMVVARDGDVVAEEHWSGPAETLRQTDSVTQSVMSILIGIAIDRGFIRDRWVSLNEHLPDHLVPSDPAKAEITIGRLLTMTSGLEWDEETDLEPWLASPDPVAEILDRPLVAAPGSAYNINSAAVHLLSVALTEATGMSTLEFADTYLFGPLGITERSWPVIGGYHNGALGLALRTEDLAKLGVLIAGRGEFDGSQLVSRYWVNRSTSPDVRNVGPYGVFSELDLGWLWWLDRSTDVRIVTAWGQGGQFIVCVPAYRLVVATNSATDVSRQVGDQNELAILDLVVNQIIPAATDRRVWTATGQEVLELVAIDDLVQDLMLGHDIRDATVAIVKDGRLVMSRGYTWGEPEVEPVSPTALYRIGSIGKAIASIAIHQLIEEQSLGYETPVSSLLDLQPMPGEQTDPWLDEVTLDHLLTHTSGMFSEDNVYVVSDDVVAALGIDPPPTKEEVATYIVSHPFVFAPGTGWDYNNYGYIMLDMMLEQVTAERYVDYLLERVFRPVGIGRARQSHMVRAELAPTEVDYDGLEGDPYRSIMDIGAAAGGLVMAAPDLARLWSALFDDPDASGLLSQQSISNMLELPFPGSQLTGYARGWYTEALIANMGYSIGALSDPDDGMELYGHGGGGSGVQTIALWREDGIVFVMFTNTDPVADEIDFPEITVWPDHDLWDSVGVSLEAVAPAPTEVWIPVVARTEGAAGSVWRSDVGLLNRSTLANLVRLRLYAASGFEDLELRLAPGEYRTVADVMASFDQVGSTPLRVFSSEALTVTSRTYTQEAAGTYGQFLTAETPSSGLQTGDRAVLMQLREDGAARTNIGLFNGWKRAAEVEIALYDGDGVRVASFEQEVPAEQTVQLNRPFLTEGGRSDIGSGYARIEVLFGRHVLAYASVVDNGTNDPTTIPMKRGTGATTQWVAAAAHAAGVNDSQWRSDLGILNMSEAAASAEVVYHADSGETASMAVTLVDGEQAVLEDVVAQLGTTGTGAIEVVSDLPALVTSRTSNASADGTFGQFLDGHAASDVAGAGDVRWLPQLAQNEWFRTNVGLVNTGAAQAEVRVVLFDAVGNELATTTQILAPSQRRQLQEPFTNIAGRNDVGAGYATVEVLVGEGILCYASVVDNASNDPTTVPMVE